MNEETRRGTELSADDQRYALAGWINRFTGEHKPKWARKPMPNGKHYKVQFKDDADWLANTLFFVTKAGRLHGNVTHCVSSPTWPLNPELRKPI